MVPCADGSLAHTIANSDNPNSKRKLPQGEFPLRAIGGLGHIPARLRAEENARSGQFRA